MLIVSPMPVIPPDQGDKLCSLSYGQRLAEAMDVHLLVLGDAPQQVVQNREPFRTVHHLVAPTPSSSRFWFRLLVQGRQPAFSFLRLSKVAREIAELASSLGVSRVHFESGLHCLIALKLQQRTGLQVSLRCLNIESRVLALIEPSAEHSSWKNLLFRLFASWANQNSFRMEMEVLRELRRVETLSYGDQKIFKENGVKAEFHYPPMPDFPHSEHKRYISAPLRLLYVGDISKSATNGGLTQALTALFPQNLSQRISGIFLDIVGAGQDTELDPWRHDPQIRFHGRIKDVEPFWQSSHALIAPLFVERGTRVKIIEALGRGVPVISPPEALYGFDPNIAEVVLLYKSPMELVALISRLRNNPEFLASISVGGREFFEKNFRSGEGIAKIISFHGLD